MDILEKEIEILKEKARELTVQNEILKNELKKNMDSELIKKEYTELKNELTNSGHEYQLIIKKLKENYQKLLESVNILNLIRI